MVMSSRSINLILDTQITQIHKYKDQNVDLENLKTEMIQFYSFRDLDVHFEVLRVRMFMDRQCILLF
jgi:hypothetical protein